MLLECEPHLKSYGQFSHGHNHVGETFLTHKGRDNAGMRGEVGGREHKLLKFMGRLNPLEGWRKIC